jgi:hypothetical protein
MDITYKQIQIDNSIDLTKFNGIKHHLSFIIIKK